MAVDMAIGFNESQWRKVKEDAEKWWSGGLGRPLIQVRLKGKEPDRKPSKYPFYGFTSFYDQNVGAEDIVDAWDYELSRTLFMGDAFPETIPNFGPGSIAAYMGAGLENGNDTVWFHPETEVEITTLDFAFLPANPWFVRTKDILRAAVDRWQGQVQIGLTDLGGNLDILSTFRPSEKLIYDLFDYPEDVKKLTWKAHKMWWKYFDEFNAITAPSNPGYSSWARIFSGQPHYILQCDFCFMVGPEMFEKFVKPELKATADKLSNAFYHLDGPGQLKHLDSILEIDSIRGVQWVPGAGQADVAGWPQVYRRITDAGRKIHIASNMTDDPFSVIDRIADQTGRADNIVYHFDGDSSQQAEAEKMLVRYGCI